jgi:RNA polymerase sigma factor (sigma-70 family)
MIPILPRCSQIYPFRMDQNGLNLQILNFRTGILKNYPEFKVISSLARLPNYMDDLNSLPNPKQHQSIQYAVQHYGKRLFSFIRLRVKNDEDAEDILQDVWVQLSCMIDTGPIEQLSAWLYRVSRNRIIDKSRKKTTLSLEDFIYEDDEGDIIFQDTLLSDSIETDSEFDAEYLRETIFKAISELPEKQRQVFVLNELEDRTLQQIADKTGESIKTIISRKRYAVAQLRKLLQDIYID